MSRPRKITKVLVANRGEIAIRVFHTCRERGLGTVAIFSDADVASPHRFAADESVRIGPPAASESYLRADRIIDAARRTGADAIHPGYGFLSESAAFSGEVEAAGITFLGPTAAQISAMGDKVEARSRMAAAGVPVIPGSAGPVDARALAKEAKKIGFPLLLKAAGGGGGKGIRRVDAKQELEAAYQRTTSEAGSAFGDSRVYLERLVQPARHVEVQILGDGKGNGLFLGERECSLQRNHQKLVEETPSPAITDAVRARMRDAALAGVRALSYRGAGTFEFLYDEAAEEFFFLEMNTRLQVEHPVTEQVTGLDLVAEQLAIGEGHSLEGVEEPTRRGCSIEFRIYAEDPYRGFRPSTGLVRALRLPHVPFGRIDACLREGWEITPWYDPMLAKAIAWGRTRPEAIDRLTALLRRIRIGGIHTTVPLGIEICSSDFFREGAFHTGTLESWLDRPTLPKEPPGLLQQLAGIVTRAKLGTRRPVGGPADAAGGNVGSGRPSRRYGAEGAPMKYRVGGDGWQHTFVAHTGPLGREWRVTDPDGEECTFRVQELEEGVLRLQLGNETHTISVLPGNRPGEPVRFLFDDEPVELHVQDEIDLLQETLGEAEGAGGRREIRSVMPGIIRKLLVEVGETIEADAPLLLLEAMKMENEIRAPVGGKVVRLAVKAGQTVAAGEILAVME